MKPLAALHLIVLTVGPAAAAGEPPLTELRSDKIAYFLSAAFAPHGYAGVKVAAVDKDGVRFRLPRPPKETSQSGLYSHFTLSGDFEFAADYAIVAMPKPAVGYGASVGLAVHTHGPGGAAFVTRTHDKDMGQCWLATHETPSESGKAYASTPTPTKALRGRLALRRAGAELTLLAAERGAPLAELKKLPFGPDPVYQIRLFADTGGADLTIDARFSNIVIKADAISGAAVPPAGGWRWTTWLLLGSVGVLALYTFLAVRRWRKNRDE